MAEEVKVFVLTEYSNDVRVYDIDGSLTHADLADINPSPSDIVIEFVNGNHFESFMALVPAGEQRGRFDYVGSGCTARLRVRAGGG